MHSDREDHGFTLVEVMAVLLILGILLTLVISVYTSSIDRTERIACDSNRRVFATAIQTYRAQYEEDPASIGDLTQFVATPNAPTCPSDNSVTLIFVPSTSSIVCPLHP